MPLEPNSTTDGTHSGKLLHINKDNFYKAYYAALETAGVRRLHPYSCRHTTATAMSIGQNIAPSIIQKVMRWSSTKMLDRYAHASSQDALSAVNKLEPGGMKIEPIIPE